MQEIWVNARIVSLTQELKSIQACSTAVARNTRKIRMRLLAMPKEEAQKLASQTIYPHLWKVRPEDIKWEGFSLISENDDGCC